MIVRSWRGRAHPTSACRYIEHFRRNVLTELQEMEGFQGAVLLREDRPDEVEFLVLTRWASMEAIRAFAGDDVRNAVVEQEAEAALLCFDRTVRHYEVVEELSLRREA
jgi:heme-degrading monooxygenase HmoA